MKIVSSFLPPNPEPLRSRKEPVAEEQKRVEQVGSSQQKLAQGSAVAKQAVTQTNNSERQHSQSQHSNQNAQNSRDSLTLEKLTQAEKQLIMELRSRDREVKMHEQQHRAAAGSLARGAIKYSYQTGPDGRRYAVGGEISIDVSPGNSPEETIKKAQQILRAASAPAEPSPQDRAVATQARQMLQQAEQELAQQRIDEQNRQVAEPVVEEPERRTLQESEEEILPQWVEDEETSAINSALFDTSGQEFLDLINQSSDQQKGQMPDAFAQSVLMTPPQYPMGVKMMIDVQDMGPDGELIRQGGNLDLFA